MNKRLKRLQNKLAETEADAILVSSPANRYYLSGFRGSAGTLLISPEKAYLYTDSRYIEQAESEAPAFTVCQMQDDYLKSLAARAEEDKILKLGFESKHITYQSYRDLEEKAGVELIPLQNVVEDFRSIKNSTEINLLRRGAAELDQAFDHICSFIKPGATEKEVALELEIFLRRRGAEKAAFTFIVASGLRGVMPHGTASDKVIEAGELVTIDFGAVFSGYATDMTRTVCIGKPDKKQREIYDLVNHARQIAVEKIRPGISGKEADQLARKIIEAAGYGSYFGHGLGHGYGLETHELPTLSPRSEQILAPDMTVTIEPGIYIPGWGGIRLEDMVIINQKEAEILTRSKFELQIIN